MTLVNGDAVDMAAFAYARGDKPRARGVIRSRHDDFRVDEDCPITLAGTGEHLWCLVEKTGLTTPDAMQRLSRAVGVHPRHIGFAGLKDKHAVTNQWFSLAFPVKRDLPELMNLEGMRLLDVGRHERKLRRGAHHGNRFVIRVRALAGDPDQVEADLRRVATRGVPNYFGPQRFGRDGRNLALAQALFAGKRLSRNRRGFALSAARSLLFNAVLDARIRQGNWETLLGGEAVMLDGSHSVFARDRTDQSAAALEERLADLDIHPSGPLPGRGPDDVVEGEARALEAAVFDDYSDLAAGLAAQDMEPARRALRLPVRELDWRFDDDSTLTLSFWLPPGAFATSVLRECLNTSEASLDPAV